MGAAPMRGPGGGLRLHQPSAADAGGAGKRRRPVDLGGRTDVFTSLLRLLRTSWDVGLNVRQARTSPFGDQEASMLANPNPESTRRMELRRLDMLLAHLE